jgi:hypothetical protein
MGISHLLIHYDIFERWVRTNFSEKGQKMLVEFFQKYVKVLFSKWEYGLFRLENVV